MTAARTVRLAIEEQDDGLRIYSGGEHAGGSARREDLAFAIERFLYAAMPAWHAPPRVILHAAGVVLGETMLVLAGRSGAGKSSLARALTERGARYATDELVVTDGERIWGIPRAIQFDAVPIDAPLPPWLGEVDRTL